MRIAVSLVPLLLVVACGGEAPAPKAPPAPVEVAEPAAAEAPAEAPKAAEATPVEPGDVARGEAIFKTNCTACHGEDGTGMNGSLAANLKEDKTRLDKSDEELLDIIENGKTGNIGTMPPWGAVVDAQGRTDVLAYLRATFQGDAKAAE
jgi:cytochrome c oxidase cbb3-type subunit 3